VTDKWTGFSIGGTGHRVSVTQNGRTFNILKDLDLAELSAVDFPAQSPALAYVTKRKTLVELTSTQPNVKKDQEIKMTDAEKKALEDAQAAEKAAVEKATKAAADLKAAETARDAAEKTAAAALELSDEHRAFAKRLPADQRAAFIAKGVGDRTAHIEGARGKEVYKSKLTGRTYFESDDPDMVELLKMNDRQAVQLETITVEKADAIIKADAIKKMSHIKADEAVKVALLKAARAIPDENTRAAAEELLEKANKNAAIPYERHSFNGAPAPDSEPDPNDLDAAVEKKVDEVAAELLKSQPSLTITKARLKAYDDPRVRDLADSAGNR
jgi:hypothetical protein